MSNVRILIIGSQGQLGSDLVRVGREQKREIIGLNPPEIDVRSRHSLQTTLGRISPAFVINTSAAHSSAQTTFIEQQAFFDINSLGAWNLACWCRAHDAVLVHYSTDYVFGADAARDRPYCESDPPCPVNIYGASKVAGELLVRSNCPRHYLLRIASVYGQTGCRAKRNSNFVKMTLGKIQKGENMRVVNDQYMSPTWTKMAALKTFELLDAVIPNGLYHLAGSGVCTWYEFACEIVRIVKSTITVEPTTMPSSDGKDIFLRPCYTALDNAKLRAAGLDDLPDWKKALQEYLEHEELKQGGKPC